MRANFSPVRPGPVMTCRSTSAPVTDPLPSACERVRQGFTLIEMLIVMVILGILTAIAMPQLAKVRERGYFKAMTSDMRNLMTQQEIYYANPAYQTYASNVAAIANFQRSPGVTVVITEAGFTGWAATSAHTGLTAAQMCAVYVGNVVTVPAPATQSGTVTCTGE